ncbi:tRNA1(Val) (adenine(37)-N6)-methyltransferase [Peptostreptococcus anaerobius]|uniref:tRNA1(Val) (adenine(37)-N6)-methyltransferase n=1 Tax=Peptostreptococcus anaerobius TaxID=1261 RepID=UPI0003409447|nr:tRNA1(Val) (adenine(37)-N6)-methyltransferase [Peptostreptococcus anaerobius]MDU3828146.1 tRNA1(Val) (adenine(37)-N6)-methyltransferase [Peptostreptococcus sp.]MDB8821012.1 tRNA1(Val) (adenine(37)-N6)-methyltransferase [Peptostreptococcus anaerobius]MDB8825490.1 tRNA1(Val) (adenine(37)-N6)-methyltransferase [Peptostreptococcus anaerobius]MDB8827584.1 tRNA1(Val) (adenine(37)-N6)-methyltransferase [Peptostreptococcus anaerobius]MDB8829401.1 tRNA1(Val) (adenine(37)-N6)-methyltransferase [Pepto
MKVELKDKERIDNLQCKGLRLIQNPDGFCFGIDAVLLANFSKVKRGSKVVDLGTGTGIIPVLISGKSRADKIIGVEIQEEVAEMATRSVKLNDLEDRVSILNEDLNNITSLIGKNTVDVVVSNPPYMHSKGIINENDKKAISRHGIMCDLEDIFRVAKDILKPNGKLYMINRTLRLVDMMVYARNHNLEPKTMKFVHSKIGKAPKLVLVEFVKCAKPEVKVLEPLYIYKEDGSYTDQTLAIYSKDSIER